MDRISPGEVPTGPDEDTPFALAPPFTTPSNKYITQVCVVCTLLLAGYTVHRTAPPYTEMDKDTGEYTACRLFQRRLCYKGFLIIDTQDRERHSRHYWACELLHWVDSVEQRARFYNVSFRQVIIVPTNQDNRALTAAGYQLTNGMPSGAGGLSFTVTASDTTHTTVTAQMTLGDSGQ